MIKSKLLAALFFCGVALTAAADEGKVDVLYVDGTSHVITLSQVAKLQVIDGNAVFSDKAGNAKASHKIADIDKISLTPGTSSVASLKGAGTVTVRSNGNAVSAEGLADGKSLEIFSMGGELVGKAVSADGKAVVNVQSLAGGVYVIKAGGQSLKMVKR